MKRLALAALLICVFGLLAFIPAIPAQAQSSTATPTATPLPSYSTTQALSGGTLLVERRVTFGDLFVGFSALLVAVTVAALALPELGAKVLKR